MKKWKVAIIGAGYMATEHAKAFADIPSVEVSGFFSRTNNRAEVLATIHNSKIFGSISELYKNTNADIAIVTVPELSMREVLKECFQFPWKILAEKPVGYNLEDALKISEDLKSSKRELFVALNRRHYNSTLTLMKEMGGHPGKRYIHIHDQEDQIAALKAGQPELVVKNWMFANSIHMVDFFTFLGRGEITSIENVIPWNPQKPDHVLTKILFSSGDVGVYEAVWNRPGPWFTVVTMDDARWEMRPVEQLACQVYGSRKLEQLPSSELDSKFKPGLRIQAQEAIKALEGEKHSLPTFSDAMKSMNLVSKIYN